MALVHRLRFRDDSITEWERGDSIGGATRARRNEDDRNGGTNRKLTKGNSSRRFEADCSQPRAREEKLRRRPGAPRSGFSSARGRGRGAAGTERCGQNHSGEATAGVDAAQFWESPRIRWESDEP